MLFFLGLLVGVLSGFLGIGGGIIIVPALVAYGYAPINAVATSAFAVLLVTLSATFYNWRKNSFALRDLLLMALPCALFAQAGVLTAFFISPALLLGFFAALLFLALFLLLKKAVFEHENRKSSVLSLLLVGSITGFLSGLFGVGGGVILVPLQVLVLKYDLKQAIRTSLAIALGAALFSSIGHALARTIIAQDALFIGLGGIIGAQGGARLLPKLSEPFTRGLFAFLLFTLGLYILRKAFILSNIYV